MCIYKAYTSACLPVLGLLEVFYYFFIFTCFLFVDLFHRKSSFYISFVWA